MLMDCRDDVAKDVEGGEFVLAAARMDFSDGYVVFIVFDMGLLDIVCDVVGLMSGSMKCKMDELKKLKLLWVII